MKRTLLLIIFSIIVNLCYAQQVDSTEIRLTQYKNLLEKKLITQEEYDKLKAKELGFENRPINMNVKQDNSRIIELNGKISDAKKGVTSDIVMSVLGGILAIGGGLTTHILHSNGNIEYGGYVGLSAASITCGVGSLVAIFDLIGKQSKIQDYKLEKENIELTLKSN